MTNRSALALAFTTGYALGRVQKLKVPLGAGAMVLGRRLGVDPVRLGERLKEKTPGLPAIPDRLRDGAGEARRAVAGGVRGRARGARELLGGSGDDGTADDSSAAEKPQKAEKPEGTDARKAAPGKPAARKTAATKGTAKKTAAKRTTAGKSAAGKSTAKKNAAKRPAKRVNGTSGRPGGTRRD